MRPIPALADTNQPILVVGSASTRATRRDPPWELTKPSFDEDRRSPSDAAADGTIIARDDLGGPGIGPQAGPGRRVRSDGHLPRAGLEQRRLPPHGDGYDILDPGTRTRSVAVGLTPGAITLTGRDAAGTTTTANRNPRDGRDAWTRTSTSRPARRPGRAKSRAAAHPRRWPMPLGGPDSPTALGSSRCQPGAAT